MIILYDKQQNIRYQREVYFSPHNIELSLPPDIYYLVIQFQGEIRKEQIIVK